MTPEKSPIPGENTQQTLAYWMGRVDSALAELRAAIEKVVKNDETNWRDFSEWRRTVDERLSQGSANFTEIDRRLDNLEKNCQGEANSNPGKIAAEKSEAEKPVFGSWAWFRDNYLEKAALVIFISGLYVLIQIIVQNWTSKPIP